MHYKRPLLTTLRALFSRPTPVIHAMVGPRQVGKTTLARQIEDSIDFPFLYATADSPVPLDAAWIETQWRYAAALAVESAKPVLLILDEVQKVRGWSETLKLLWDARATGPEIRVLVLGSSALLMQEGLSESLTGRFFCTAAPIGALLNASRPLAGAWSNGSILAATQARRCLSTMNLPGNAMSPIP